MEQNPGNLDVQNRQIEDQRSMMAFLPQMITPQTTGYDHINLDLAFSNLDHKDLMLVENYMLILDVCKIYKLKESYYMVRGMLAGLLNSRRSKFAKSMNLFTHVSTSSKTEYTEVEQAKKGFNFFGFGRKNS
jgi:hypothetical protein